MSLQTYYIKVLVELCIVYTPLFVLPLKYRLEVHVPGKKKKEGSYRQQVDPPFFALSRPG